MTNDIQTSKFSPAALSDSDLRTLTLHNIIVNPPSIRGGRLAWDSTDITESLPIRLSKFKHQDQAYETAGNVAE